MPTANDPPEAAPPAAESRGTTRVRTEAATSSDDTPARPAGQTEAPAHHAFAPTTQEPRPEAACGEARVGFVAGSSVLSDDARGRLDAYAACMTNDRAQAVYILGTTDPGPRADIALANARARVVAEYLHQDGLHMDFEVHAYRAGGTPQLPAASRAGRSVTVTTESPYRAVPR